MNSSIRDWYVLENETKAKERQLDAAFFYGYFVGGVVSSVVGIVLHFLGVF